MGDELDAAEPEFELSDFEAYNAALSPIMKADSRVGVAVLRLSRETPLFVHHWWKMADPNVSVISRRCYKISTPPILGRLIPARVGVAANVAQSHILRTDPRAWSMLNSQQAPYVKSLFLKSSKLRELKSRGLIAQETDLGVLKFEDTPYVEPSNGQTYRSFDMDRDGFMVLAMDFTGKKALFVFWDDKFNADNFACVEYLDAKGSGGQHSE